MVTKSRIVIVGILLGALALGGLLNLPMLAQSNQLNTPPAGARGGRELFRSFFQAMTAGDLVLLKDGGAISGTVQGDPFSFTPTSGQLESLKRSDIALMSFGDKSDQLILSSGSLVTGNVQMDNLVLTSPSGTQVTIPKANIGTTIFKINPPTSGQGNPQQQALFKAFRSLGAQQVFGLFVKSLTTYDLASFSNHELWSGSVLNQQIVFQSTLFGTLTLKASDVASVQLASDSSGTDFINLKAGDRLSGQLDTTNGIQFQPLGLTDDQGKPVTLTLNRGDISLISFRLPASAFGGGGQGPGFGGGPGH